MISRWCSSRVTVSSIPPTPPRTSNNARHLDLSLFEVIAYRGRPMLERRTVDSNTIFRIGSITKLITDIMLFKLRDEGKLSLDDPVSVRASFISCRWSAPVQSLLNAIGLTEIRAGADVAIAVQEQPRHHLAHPCWPD